MKLNRSILKVIDFQKCLGALFLCITLPVFAQSQSLRFDHLTIEDGLSQNTVTNILQDDKGYMWFATEDGLNRYDGIKFKVFGFNSKNKSSNHFNFVNTLHKDKAGNIWIGTRSNGLFRYNSETEYFGKYSTNDGDHDNLAFKNVTAIKEDDAGNLWIGTAGGLMKLNPEDKTFDHFVYDPKAENNISGNDILSLSEIRDNILWIGTRMGGLIKLDIKTEQFSTYMAGESVNQLKSNTINSIVFDKSHKLWLGTSFGVEIYNPIQDRFEFLNDLPNNPIRVLFFDRQQNLWIGSDEGLYLYDSLLNGFQYFIHEPENPYGLNNSRINDIKEDDYGTIWVGTSFGGINKFDPGKHKFRPFRYDPNNSNSLPSNIMRFFLEIEDEMFIGTLSGISIYDPLKNTFRKFDPGQGKSNSLPDQEVRTMIIDTDGKYWLGSRNGLAFYDPQKNILKNFFYDLKNEKSLSGNHIRILLQEGDYIWVGTHDNGLNKIHRKTHDVTRYFFENPEKAKVSAKRISALHLDKKGTLWIGSNGAGIIKRVMDDNGQETYVSYVVNDTLPGIKSNIIKSFLEDSKGNFWIATGNGFAKMDKEKGTFQNYSVAEGLPNNMVYGILEDKKGDFWISTNNGISRFNVDSETFHNYDINDGLQSNEFNTNAFYKSNDGKMYFGGVNGMNIFYPEDIFEIDYIPQVHITDFQLFYVSQNGQEGGLLRRHISSIDNLSLNYDHNIFSFDFVALHYSNPAKNQYKYILEGFDNEWIEAKNRNYASYTNIPPGEYVFRVMGSNSDGVWNPNDASIGITIIPPFWQKSWFYITVTSVIILGMVFLVKLRERNLRNIQSILENRVIDRTRQLEEEKDTKDKFFSIIAHDIKGPLHTFKGFSHLMRLNSGQMSKDDIQKITTEMDKSMNNLSDLLDNLLQWAQSQSGGLTFSPEKLNLKDVVLSNVELYKNQAKEKQQNLHLELSDEMIWMDKNGLDTVIRNLVGNAIKFTNPKGNIYLKSIPNGRFCELEIRDDGVGIDKKTLSKLFRLDVKHSTRGTANELGTGLGLLLCKEFMLKSKGNISVESEVGKGSTFKIIIPRK